MEKASVWQLSAEERCRSPDGATFRAAKFGRFARFVGTLKARDSEVLLLFPVLLVLKGLTAMELPSSNDLQSISSP